MSIKIRKLSIPIRSELISNCIPVLDYICFLEKACFSHARLYLVHTTEKASIKTFCWNSYLGTFEVAADGPEYFNLVPRIHKEKETELHNINVSEVIGSSRVIVCFINALNKVYEEGNLHDVNINLGVRVLG